MTLYTATPVEFEIYDEEAKMLAVKVTMFDEAAAKVDIQIVVDRRSFDALVPAIQSSLSQMKFEGEK